MEKQGQYFHMETRHYSGLEVAVCSCTSSLSIEDTCKRLQPLRAWAEPTMQEIELDLDGLIEFTKFRKKLEYCAKENQPVYAAVAVMDSTEEGAQICEFNHCGSSQGWVYSLPCWWADVSGREDEVPADLDQSVSHARIAGECWCVWS